MMTSHPEVDWIPAYASADVKRAILDLTVESEPEVSAVECCDHLIRHWCETVEDGNPLYLDEEYAKSRGFKGVVAQPGMIICTLTMPYRWPSPPKDHKPQLGLIHLRLKDLLNLPVAVVVDYDTEFLHYVESGDRLSTTSKLLSISPWKRTSLGEGHFWTIEQTYRNQNAEVVCYARTTHFSYREGSAQEGEGA
jgi:acyl dehydratase